MAKRSKKRVLLRAVQIYIPVVVVVVFFLFPFYWMLITSFKANPELYSLKTNPLWVTNPTLDHFRFLFEKTLFSRWILNTMIVALASTAISVVCSVFAGYALSRMRFPGAGPIGLTIFLTYLVPPTLLFLPLTQLMINLGLGNSRWSLILAYPTFLIPFGTWLMMSYFRSIPRDLEEAALVDGVGRTQAFLEIILPLALPGLLSVAFFSFTLSWNEYLYALVFISDPNIKTVSVGITSELIRGDVFYWGELMAAAMLGSIPVAIIYSFFVDYFIAGLTAGAVKG